MNTYRWLPYTQWAVLECRNPFAVATKWMAIDRAGDLRAASESETDDEQVLVLESVFLW